MRFCCCNVQKKNPFFQLDKLPVGRTMVQLVPPAFGFGDDAVFEFLERLQSPLSMTALPLRVKSCLMSASGVGHALLTKINCSDSCCCPDISHRYVGHMFLQR